jgi:hypothetical protein
VATALHTAVSCGSLVVAGRQTVGGTETIKLTSRTGSPLSETIWVSPSTYLPVRVVARAALGLQQTADFTWLQPTAQNLAKLAVPIPAGFRKVPLLQAIAPNLKQIPAGTLPRPVARPLPPPRALAIPRPGAMSQARPASRSPGPPPTAW